MLHPMKDRITQFSRSSKISEKEKFIFLISMSVVRVTRTTPHHRFVAMRRVWCKTIRFILHCVCERFGVFKWDALERQTKVLWRSSTISMKPYKMQQQQQIKLYYFFLLDGAVNWCTDAIEQFTSEIWLMCADLHFEFRWKVVGRKSNMKMLFPTEDRTRSHSDAKLFRPCISADISANDSFW